MREHSYKAAWRDLERRETIFKVLSWIAIPLTFIPELVFIPLIFVAFFIFDFFSIRSLPWQVSLFVLMVTFSFLGLLCVVLSFRCPCCRKLFFFKRIYFSHDPHDGNHCVHCGLAKGAMPEVPSGRNTTAP